MTRPPESEVPPPPSESDEDLVRRAFALIGEEAARPDPRPLDHVSQEGTRRPWWRRRALVPAALTTAAALCVGLLALTLADDGTPHTLSDDDAGSGRGQTLPEWIACATTVAEGDVVSVRPSSEAGRLVVTFDVRDWIKPDRGERAARRITLDVVDPTEARVHEPWKAGQHLLIVVPQRRDQETDTFQEEMLEWYRPRIDRALPEAATTECPPEWRDPSRP